MITYESRILRLPLATGTPDSPLDLRLKNLCDLQGNTGFRLASSFTVGTELVLIFQKQHEV